VDRILKRLHYPVEVILLCVRWYVAYSLNSRNLEEMMAEGGVAVDHSTVYRWVIKLSPLFEKTFRKHNYPIGKSWRMARAISKSKASVNFFTGQWTRRATRSIFYSRRGGTTLRLGVF
jgi:putative transposase